MRYKYKDSELKILLRNLVILKDSREQQADHITDIFDQKKKAYKVVKLDQGDYSIMLESNAETKLLGINRDIWFDKEVVIERKASIDEMAGNFKEPERGRIAKEFAHLKANGTKVYFWVEDKDFDYNIRNHVYRSEYNEKALYKSIIRFIARYNLNFRGIDKSNMWSEIYNILECEVVEILKNKGFIDMEVVDE